ncbi:MAG: hypothetical protein CMM03_13265 [Rhodopirellula sp.]|nr:hypothetical protein [Rhodopirellula sp.]
MIGSIVLETSHGAEVSELTAIVNKIGIKGQGHSEARKAMRQLAQLEPDSAVAILTHFDSSNKLAVNWLRAAVDGILEDGVAEAQELPIAALVKFLHDREQDANARRVAYEWIIEVEPQRKSAILEKSLNDPSLEIRREAVAFALGSASNLEETSTEKALEKYRATLVSARDIDQIDSITKSIERLGGTVDLPSHFGFLMNWHLIGPFDNSGKSGFNVAYGPENAIKLQAAEVGKTGSVKWFEHSTEDPYGLVDLNSIMPEKYKGAIVYAYTTFDTDSEREVEIRLGCINGNKVWVNGKLITSNHVYHANTSIDQYIAKAKFRAGTNEILVKVAQNEQEESWAQRWQFQLRICDQYGTAILSKNRKE